MKFLLNLSIFILILCCTACKNNNTVKPLAADEYVSFELDLPANWKQQKLQGIDSYFGFYTDKNDTIYYDHGAMAQQDPKWLVKNNKNGKILEEYSRKGVKTTIYSYNFGLKRFVGAYFSGGLGSEITSLYVTNYFDQKKVIELMKTHKFVRVKR